MILSFKSYLQEQTALWKYKHICVDFEKNFSFKFWMKLKLLNSIYLKNIIIFLLKIPYVINCHCLHKLFLGDLDASILSVKLVILMTLYLLNCLRKWTEIFKAYSLYFYALCWDILKLVEIMILRFLLQTNKKF